MTERGSDGANGYILARSHEVADKIVLFFFSKSEKIWRRIDGFISLFICKWNLWEKRGKINAVHIYVKSHSSAGDIDKFMPSDGVNGRVEAAVSELLLMKT